MNFSPLGLFNARAPINRELLLKAGAWGDTLPNIPDGSGSADAPVGLCRGYLHWSVGAMNCGFADYDAMLTFANGVWAPRTTGNVLANARGDEATDAHHTWHRNSHAFGLALAGMDGATVDDFGPDPVTLAGLEWLCAMAAVVGTRYDFSATDVMPNGELGWMTHAEAAIADKYFPYPGLFTDSDVRWDLATFVPLPAGVTLTPDMAKQCGDALRARIALYEGALLS